MAGFKINPEFIKSVRGDEYGVQDKDGRPIVPLSSELAQFRSRIAPRRMLTRVKENFTLTGEGLIDGKRTVLIDMLQDNLNSLASVRGRDIRVSLNREAKMGDSITTAIMQSTDSPYLASLDAVLQCLPRFRGADPINPLAYINVVTAPVLMFSEWLLHSIGSFLTYPYHRVKEFSKANKIHPFFDGCLKVLAAPFWIVGQACFVAGNIFRYTRHVIDGVANFVSSACAKLTKSPDYGIEIPTLKVCANDIGKNAALLLGTGAVAAVIVGLACIPGLQPLLFALPFVGKIGGIIASIGIMSAITTGIQRATSFIREKMTGFSHKRKSYLELNDGEEMDTKRTVETTREAAPQTDLSMKQIYSALGKRPRLDDKPVIVASKPSLEVKPRESKTAEDINQVDAAAGRAVSAASSFGRH